MKESHLCSVVEFAKARGIEKEPASAWQVPCTLCKCNVMIEAVKSQACKVSHKYGIEVPTSADHACELDQRN